MVDFASDAVDISTVYKFFLTRTKLHKSLFKSNVTAVNQDKKLKS